jgi:hypothetical protein
MPTNGWNGSKWCRRDFRLAVLDRDGYQCAYCGSRWKLELDHLKPRSKGGDNAARNLITACKKCNGARGDTPWWEFADDDAQARIKRQRRRGIKMRRKWAKRVIGNYDTWTEALNAASNGTKE